MRSYGGVRLKHRQISIKLKIFFYLIGFCVLLLLILWLFQIILLNSFYKQIKLSQIKRETASIEYYIRENDMEKLTEVIMQEDLYVEIWRDRFGTVLTGGTYSGVQTKLTYEQKESILIQAKDNGGTLIKHYLGKPLGQRYTQESILYTVLVPGSDGTEALLMVSAVISPVDATVDTLRVQLFYISTIMLALSVGLAILIARRVSAPIEKLNRSALELGAGNYDVEFHGEGYREIKALSDTLNHAAGELGNTEKLRQELIANVSHDLRTPLTLITGYGEMIRDLPGENTSENMQVIIDESKRLTSLVNNLLDLSRLQSGTQKIRRELFSLTTTTRDIIRRVFKFSRKDGHEILFEQDQEVSVYGDPDRISQVIYNLLINAVTHTGASRQVIVRQMLENGRVTLLVIDQGEGIPAEDLPHIWDRYYRVDKVHKRAVAGSGLGLSIVKAVLEQHPDVEFGVESTVGQGSTFWFSLPLSC